MKTALGAPLGSVAVLVAAVVLALAACGPSLTPEEEIEVKRSHFTAELTSWTVNQDPVSGGDAVEEGQEDAEEPAAGETAVATEVMLDILVSSDVDDAGLDGVTVDLTQVDSQMNEKARRTLWIDAPPTARGSGSQVTHILDDVDYAPGDMFHVEVRVPIPPAERGAYREFASLR